MQEFYRRTIGGSVWNGDFSSNVPGVAVQWRWGEPTGSSHRTKGTTSAVHAPALRAFSLLVPFVLVVASGT